MCDNVLYQMKGCEMAKKLGELTDGELQEAKRRLGKLTQEVQKNANEIPWANWGPIIEQIEGCWKELDEEENRRYKP
jgi:hypothetical protein